MGKTSFQSLDQLAQYISDNITKLNNGNLNSSEIEDLTENTRDLHERLIVIRHKAYEKFGNPDETLTIEEEAVNTPEPIVDKPVFDLTPEEPIKESAVEEDSMMSFDFSEPVETLVSPVIEKVPGFVEENIVEAENVIQETAESISIEKEIASLGDSLSSNSTSLNDAFKTSGSLSDKLNQSKIEDLKSHIGINKKFSFITDLFSGSNEDYNEAINALNSCSSGDEARQILGELAENNAWDVENATVSKFVYLVERRYL